MDNIKDIIKPLEIKKAPAYKWQELALEILEKLPDSKPKRSSIFKCCKENPQFAKIAFEDCKELGKLHTKYFLKVFNELKKGKK